MKRILINFAHPSKSRSKMNTALLNAVEDLENVYINDLYSNYPDFMIDVKREKELCSNSDVIIFQHPLYWYSAPSIIKEWQDLVLEHGWAYGSKSTALKGKYFFQTITAAGNENTYRRQGTNRYTINELVSPYHAMADICKMIWLPPFAVMGIHRGLGEKKTSIIANNYRKVIKALRDDDIDIDKAKQFTYLNSDIDAIIRRSK